MWPHDIRAKLPDDQWFGSEVALTTAGLEGHEIRWRSRSMSERAGRRGGTMSKGWFITGASSGLGRHLTALALSEGDAVTAAVRRPDALRDLADTYSGRLTVEALDVTSSQDVSRVVARCLARGRIDVVVNNAGGGLIGATEEMTDAQVQQQITLNLLAPIQITRAFLKPMREQGGGRIIRSRASADR